MEVIKYGISLNRLKEEDIELVRGWRNSPSIRQYMEFRDEITPEMQKAWFDSVNNTENYYFIIAYQQKKIGLINTSKVDWDTMSSEGGIFLWDETYYETFVPVWASLALLETTFFVFNAQYSYIKTLRNNERAKKLNQHLGYELQDGQEEVNNQLYMLSKENFVHHAKKLIKAASLLAGTGAEIHTMHFDNQDIESGLADFLYDKMNKDRVKVCRTSPEGRLYEFGAIAV